MDTRTDTPALHDRSLAEIAATIVAWNCVGTVVAQLFEATFRPSAFGHDWGARFLHSVTYANCIGTLVAAGMIALAPRIARVRFPLDWGFAAAAALVLAAAGNAIAACILMAFGAFPRDLSWLAPRRMGLGLLLGVIFGGGLYGYESIRLRLRARELERARAQQLALQASLSSLESRVRPHFLFNTLNSIASLIADDPRAAEATLGRLAALLRFSLDGSHRGTIPLERELAIAVDYLEIEKVRFGARLRYSVDVPAELQSAAVPPFVIQTLVENSVRHAVSSRPKGGAIAVRASNGGGRLTISVHDDGPGFGEEAIVAGHGLHNIRERLHVLFGRAAELRVGPNAVTVSLPRS